MSLLDLFWARLNQGPTEVIYDAALWFFLLIRLVPFIRHFRDDLVRNLYFAVLFSAMYASSVGIFIDSWVSVQDSEFRIVAGVIGAFFILQLVLSLWKRFGNSEFLFTRLLTARRLPVVNISWLLLSLFSFIGLEVFLGGAAVYQLHTESFSIGHNPYLGLGRIITRSYILFAITLCSLVLFRLIRTSFAHDPRLRLRFWAGLSTVILVGVHYVNVSLGTLIAVMNYSEESLVREIYEPVALVTVILSSISIILLASPRSVLDFIIRQRYRFRSYLSRKSVDSLRQDLVDALTQRGEVNVPASFLQPQEKGSYAQRLTHSIIAIVDMRRLLFCYLSDHDVEDLMSKVSEYQLQYRNISKSVLVEALLLNLALEKMRSKESVPYDQLPSGIPETQISVMEDLSAFYSDVRSALRRVKHASMNSLASQRVN